MNIFDKIHLKILQARIDRIKRKNPNLTLGEPIKDDYENSNDIKL